MTQNKTIVIGTKHLLFGALIIGIIVGFIFLGKASASEETNQITGNTIANAEGTQHVRVSMTRNEYIFTPPTVTKDIPVRMEVDMNSVVGCYRSIVIPQLDVRTFVSPQDNIIEFTPTKTGTMKVSSSMDMGSGSFTVV